MKLVTAAVAVAALGVAATAATGATVSSKSTSSCPSDQTVMTSTWYGAASASNGTSYLCALEYHDGDMNLNALASHTFSQFVNVAYFPQYYCWNGTNSAIGFSHAEIFGSGSVTATNWDVTTNHHWGAGYLYTLGSGSVTGFTNGCSATSSQVWNYPPDLLRITAITASGLPDTTVPAGTAINVSVNVNPGSYAAGAPVVLQDNGVNVATSTLASDGTATIKWTPAQMGARTITVAWPGTSSTLGNITVPYTVNVSGGLGLAVSPNVSWDTGNDTAQALVTLDATPNSLPTSAMKVVLQDVATKTQLGSVAVTPAAGTSTLNVTAPFNYTQGQTYKLVAVVPTSQTTFAGVSYVTQVTGAVYTPAPYNPPPCKPGKPCAYSRENDLARSGGQQLAEKTAPRQATARGTGTRGRATPPAGLRPTVTGTASFRKSSRVTARSKALSISCPDGYFPLDVSAATPGPDTDFGISYGASGAKVTSPPGNVGYRMTAQAICRVEAATAVVTGPSALGTRGPDTLVTKVPSTVAFGGPGRDRIAVTGSRSVAWGGVGHDRVAVKGTDSVGDGGPGRDRLIALGSARSLLIGGRGPDMLVGGPGATYINAMDGSAGDRVRCRSAKNRVLADPGDILTGPCEVLAAP